MPYECGEGGKTAADDTAGDFSYAIRFEFVCQFDVIPLWWGVSSRSFHCSMHCLGQQELGDALESDIPD